MNASTKLLLTGLAVDMFATWRADVARSMAGMMGDPVVRLQLEQEAQAFEVASVGGKAAFWYALYQKYPKLTLAAGTLGMAAYYLPKTALAMHRISQKHAHAAHAFGAETMPAPPMSAWQGAYG